jgi:hypothetical protein
MMNYAQEYGKLIQMIYHLRKSQKIDNPDAIEQTMRIRTEIDIDQLLKDNGYEI